MYNFHIEEIFTNYVLLCAVVGWLTAQMLKIVTATVKNKRFSLMYFFASGGMPSSHSSTVCALACATGKSCGFGSVLFAITAILAFVVMYDAAGVRRAAGEQAKLLNKLMLDLEEGKTENVHIQLKELIGHTPLQVFAGAALGIIIPVLI